MPRTTLIVGTAASTVENSDEFHLSLPRSIAENDAKQRNMNLIDERQRRSAGEEQRLSEREE
jgi:hypothetical protein